MDPSPVSASESPPGRSTILPSFLRRPRPPQSAHPAQPTLNTAVSRDPIFLLDDPPPTAISPGASNKPQSASHRRRHPQQGGSNIIQPSISATAPSSSSLGLSHMLRRRRSVGTVTPNPIITTTTITTTTAPLESRPSSASTPTHKIRLVPHLDSWRSLKFDPISRDLREGDPALRIGRFTDRSGLNALNPNKLAFKSKVVSRAHAEIWVDSAGNFLIRDTKSSSGTFLNHMRLSAAGKESKPFPLKDGDVLQLGVDYQGGTEDIYKSVKIKIELGREWQASANAFNTNAMRSLKTLAATNPGNANGKSVSKSGIPDCCICLFTVTIRQALFIAPCSHTFHYKCIKPLLDAHHPAFSCPLCRTFADLDEDVEVEATDFDGMVDPTTDKENDSDHGEEMDINVDGTPLAHAAPLPTLSLPTGFVVVDRERDPGAETEVEPDNAAGNGNGHANANTNGLHPYVPRRGAWSRSDGEPSASRHPSEGGEPGQDPMSGVFDGTAPDRTSVNFGVSPSLIRMPLGWEDGEMDVDGFPNSGGGGGGDGAHDAFVVVDVVRNGHGGDSSGRTSADASERGRLPEEGADGEMVDGGAMRKRMSSPLSSL